MIKVVNIKENKLNEITDKLGKEEILCQLSEECFELIQACLKYRRTMKGLTPKTEKETRDNLIEEMADVLLNIEQLISLLGEDTNREIDIIQAYKTDRWWNRTFFGQNTNCNSENPWFIKASEVDFANKMPVLSDGWFLSEFWKEEWDILIVNLFGVPGAGKSTGAAYIFSQLKMHGINAELVTEFAKDKVWENNTEVFKNQAYLFGKQSYRISRCKDKVDVIVTDSPLPLSIFYNNDPSLTENFNKSVMDVFNHYNNVNYLLLRTKPYNPIGRHQSEEESDALKQPMIDLLNKYGIDYIEVNGDIEGYDWIVNDVLNRLKMEE